MSFSQITAVDLVVNQIVTIVTKYSPSSPAGIHAVGDVTPTETIVRTSSNVGLNQINTRRELSNTVQVYNPLYSFGNQTFNYSNSPLPDIKSQLSITQPIDLGNRPFGFNIIGNATPVVDTGASYGRQPFLIYNTLPTVSSLDPVLELTNSSLASSAAGSILFNGTTQLLTVTNAAFTYTGNFTVEGWYYPTNVTGIHSLFCLGTEIANRYVWALSGTSVTSNLFGAGTVTYTSTVPINTWTHIAVVRLGSTVKVYINGTASATTDTQAGTIGNGVLKIASDSGGAALFAGYISNFRTANTAIYPGNFTTVVPLIRVNGEQLVLLVASSGALLTDSGPGALTVTGTGTPTYSSTVIPTKPAVIAYYNYSQLYFNGGLNIPYGDITSNVSGYSAQTYTAPGTYSWTVPAGVYNITLGAVGAGGGGVQKTGGGAGGSGGNVVYYNSYTVTPGVTYTIVVGSGGAPGAVVGTTGGSTYMTQLGSNVAIVAAGGGAGGNSLYWQTDEISVQSQDASGIIARVTAIDPNARTITYNISSGSLPIGAALNTANGAITWTKQNLSSVTEYAPFTVSATVSLPTQVISKQYTIRIDTISYSITANVSGSVLYGSTITYVITTTGVADGTTLYWTNDGTTTVDEFTDNVNNGIVTVNGGGVTLTRTLVSIQPVTSFSGSIIINLRTESRSGTIVATGPTISTSPQSFAITSNVASLIEGNIVQYTVTTGNVINGAVLYWTNAGNTSAVDFSDTVNSGFATINSNTATITRNVISDLLSEGTESILLQLRRGSTIGTFVANAAAVTVNESVWLTASVSYLIVGGGGAGGRQQNYQGTGGGGGAGGLTYGSFSIGDPLTITIGAGGSGSGGNGNGNNGGDTIILQGSLTRSIAYGGGGGGIGDDQYGGAASIHTGNSGGSGGGGSGSDGTFNGVGGSAIQPSSIYGGLGNSGGGVGFPGGGSRTGGYGGGAGGGYTGTPRFHAYGNGISLTTALASFPTTTYSGNFAQGGADGGGAEGSDTPGAANTGNGGDGGNTFNGGAVSGGSGIAFLWWPDQYPIPSNITGTYTYTNENGYRIYKFITSGSITF